MSKFNQDRDPYSEEYVKWRKAIKSRDKKCQMPGCKYRGTKFDCHHISRWVDAPGSRFDVKNGILLCKTHHNEIKNKESFYASLFRQIVKANEDKRKGKK